MTWQKRINQFGQTDFVLLIFSFLSTLLLLLSTGFNPERDLLGSYDLASQHLAFYRFPYHHHPQEYWTDILGGSLGHSVYGMPFLYWLYTFKLVSLQTYFFIFHLTIMSALPYFAFKILKGILPFQNFFASPALTASSAETEQHPAYSPFVSFIIIFCLAAMPAMGSKIIAGHDNIILGAIFFFIVVSWVLTVWEKRSTLTHLIFSLIILCQIFPYYNYHMLHTAIFYGWPLGIILLGLYSWPKQNPIIRQTPTKKLNVYLVGQKLWQNYRIPLLLFGGAFAICFYQFYGMITTFMGDDLARGLEGSPATFSYRPLLHTWYDWLNSLWISSWWTKIYFPDIFEHVPLHETNCPLGPWLFITGSILLIKPRFFKTLLAPRLVGGLFLLWWLWMMLFCLNIQPISTIMLKIVPYAGSFRIPNRVFFVGLYALQIIGFWMWDYFFSSTTNTHTTQQVVAPTHNTKTFFNFSCSLEVVIYEVGLILLIILISTSCISSAASELITDLGLILICLIQVKSSRHPYLKHDIQKVKMRYIAGIILLASLNWQGFKDRTEHQYASWEKYVGILLTSAKLNDATSQRAPLERFIFGNGIIYNFGLLGQIPTLDGYAVPLKRFSQLHAASNKYEYNPLEYNFKTTTSMPYFEVVKHLYAINYFVTSNIRENHRLYGFEVNSLPRTPNFWIPQETFKLASSYSDLIIQLDNAIKDNHIFSTLYLEQGDLDRYIQAKNLAQDKSNLRLATRHERHGQKLLQLTLTPEYQAQTLSAPIIFAMNYASHLIVLGGINENDDRRLVLPTFAAYGPLLGVFVPPGITHLELYAVHPWPSWGILIILLGIGCLAMTFYFWSKAIPRKNDFLSIHSL